MGITGNTGHRNKGKLVGEKAQFKLKDICFYPFAPCASVTQPATLDVNRRGVFLPLSRASSTPASGRDR